MVAGSKVEASFPAEIAYLHSIHYVCNRFQSAGYLLSACLGERSCRLVECEIKLAMSDVAITPITTEFRLF